MKNRFIECEKNRRGAKYRKNTFVIDRNSGQNVKRQKADGGFVHGKRHKHHQQKQQEFPFFDKLWPDKNHQHRGNSLPQAC